MLNERILEFIILIVFIFTITGCAAKDRKLRLIYVEDPTQTRYYNLEGKECILSGEDVDPQVYEDKGYPEEVKILNTYKNCDFHKVRILKEREKLMWGVPIRPEQFKKKRRMR